MKKYLMSFIAALIIFPVDIVWVQAAGESEVAAAVKKAAVSDSAITQRGKAFGITLGKRFESSMVVRVIDRQPHSYTSLNGPHLEGTVIHVEPSLLDERFQDYSVKTTDEGIIYSIQAEYQFEVEPAQGKKMGRVKEARVIRSTCKAAVKGLAHDFEAIYGEPRGQGWDGEWFSFRQLSDQSDISLNLYANRCRTGFYSLVMVDKKIVKK